MLLASAAVFSLSPIPPAEAERIGVYILATIFGLLVTGLISCAKEIRNDLRERS